MFPDLWMAVVAVSLGGMIGIVQGTLGAGGAILTLPVLVYVLGAPVPVATGTSIAVTCLNASVGALQAWRVRRALPRVSVVLGVGGILGTFAGAWLNHRTPEVVVLGLFGLIMLASATSMVRGGTGSESAKPAPLIFTPVFIFKVVTVGLCVGTLTGLFGVGGGFLLVPALVTVLGVPMRMAAGTSMMAITLNSIWGLAAHTGLGGIDWLLVALLGGSGIVGVVAGGHLSGRVPERHLRRAFAGLVFSLAVYTLARNGTALVATITS
jgi:uncharacterized protein